MRDVATANRDLDVVYSESDVMHAGIKQALTQAGIYDKVLYASYDGGMNFIKEMVDDPKGPEQANASNQPYDQGVAAVKQILAAVNGTPKEESCPGGTSFIETVAVTPENAEKYYNPDFSTCSRTASSSDTSGCRRPGSRGGVIPRRRPPAHPGESPRREAGATAPASPASLPETREISDAGPSPLACPTFFNDHEARTVDAIAARVIRDAQTPVRARRARRLHRPIARRRLSGLQPLYQSGVRELDELSRERHVRPFDELGEGRAGTPS
jgi:hypothetical protein